MNIKQRRVNRQNSRVHKSSLVRTKDDGRYLISHPSSVANVSVVLGRAEHIAPVSIGTVGNDGLSDGRLVGRSDSTKVKINVRQALARV